MALASALIGRTSTTIRKKTYAFYKPELEKSHTESRYRLPDSERRILQPDYTRNNSDDLTTKFRRRSDNDERFRRVCSIF